MATDNTFNLLAKFHVPMMPFLQYLKDHNAIVSGSAALWGWMKNMELEPTFEPNDIDIWMGAQPDTTKVGTHFLEMPEPPGCTREPYEEEYKATYQLKVCRIDRFRTPNGKEVQVIQVHLTSTQTFCEIHSPLRQWITNNYDISCCCAFLEGDGKFSHAFPKHTAKMQMCWIGEDEKVTNKEARIAKYESRGFELVD
jgi:hypothetical protein